MRYPRSMGKWFNVVRQAKRGRLAERGRQAERGKSTVSRQAHGTGYKCVRCKTGQGGKQSDVVGMANVANVGRKST